MRCMIKHYYDFGQKAEVVGENLLSPDSWERLRMEKGTLEIDSAFALPKERSYWIRVCHESLQTEESARDIGRIIRLKQITNIFSVGVGRACVEYHLKAQFPEVRLKCTEFSPGVVQRLREIFTECDQVEFFDITSRNWPLSDDRCLHLLNRVDTELDNEKWQEVFANMAQSKVENVLFVVSGYLSWRTLAQELWCRCRSLFLGRQLTFAGYLRTKDVFRTLWAPYYFVEEEGIIGGLSGFLLRRV